jgi:hypothetical protein
MRSVFYLFVAVSVLACAQAPDESSTSEEVISNNRIALNRIALNRIALNRIALNRIALNRIALNRLSVNQLSAGDLLATAEGRELFSLVVSCALPSDVTLVATVDGADFEFLGEIGLAQQWLSSRLDRVGQQWVSACMYARVNAHEVIIAISMRGPHRELAADAAERAAFTLEEGAFFGDAFGPLDQPLRVFACRGRDKAAGNAGVLADRDCAAPDPANPGFTLCGMTFAGDCGSFASDQACESFSNQGTFYRQCHTSPIQHRGNRGGNHEGDDDPRVFEQVITTFVTP